MRFAMSLVFQPPELARSNVLSARNLRQTAGPLGIGGLPLSQGGKATTSFIKEVFY